MTKKKTETKKEEENVFDYQKILDKMEIPEMLKKAFQYYIINNNITFKSENELKETLKQFKLMNAGA